MSLLYRLFDVLVPRFVTEDVALNYDDADGMWEIVCSLEDVEPGERFDAIASVQCFSIFGYGLFPRQVGDMREWRNPHDV